MNEQVAPVVAASEAAEQPPPLQAVSTRRSSSRPGWWAAGIVTAAAVSGASWWLMDVRSTVHYTTAVVSRGAILRTITATGTVNPELTVIVGTYVSGVIQELHCDYNTEVKKGLVCARIDPRPYQTAVDQSRANLAIAKAQLAKDTALLAYAKAAFERTARLLRTNAVSQDAFDVAKSAHDQALAQIQFDEATIQQRQAALDAALVNLDYTNIVSPVDGTVVSRNVTVGQTVAASFQTPTLFLIATDLTRMQLDANVSESDIGVVKRGDAARFTVDAFPGRTFNGIVSQVRQSPQTVQNVVTYDVVVSVENADLALKPGMTAATRIVVARRDDAVRVPNLALRYKPGGLADAEAADQPLVWMLKGGRAMAAPVVPGLDDDNYTEIVSGQVEPGDRVITAEQSVSERRTVMPRLQL